MRPAYLCTCRCVRRCALVQLASPPLPPCRSAGVTQRRWLAFCNPPLRALITKGLGNEEWILDLSQLQGLRKLADDAEYQKEWAAVKQQAKAKLAGLIMDKTAIKVRATLLD